MRIAIIAMGTRGDVQPYIALAKGLQEAAHVVRLLTHQNYKGLVTSHGLEFWPIKGDVQKVMETQEMRELLEKGNFFTITSRTAKEAQRAAIHWAEDGLAACRGMDLIIAGIGGLFIGFALAEKLDLPFLQAYLVPFTTTKAFPSVLLPTTAPKLGSVFNQMSHSLTRQMMWQGFRSADRLARQQGLGLPANRFLGPFNAEKFHRYPILYGYSPTVLPKPGDWDDHIYVTGYWFLDLEPDWTPPPALLDFLQGDPPPLYIGFGSMSNRKPQETTDLVLPALAQTKTRAVMLSGWGGMGQADLPDSVFMVDAIPHAWLFPRVAAVVHHGGAGTTAAGLRAGVPSIVMPFFGDQFFWGQRVVELGIGPEPIPRKKLTVDRLAQAIQTAVTDQTMRRRATDMGVEIRAEDGVGRAVEVIGNAMGH